MANKNNIQVTEEDIRKMEESRIRKQRKEQGAFDGRFVTRPHGKKKYSRKVKHKNDQID